jgi:hypothetical protein
MLQATADQLKAALAMEVSHMTQLMANYANLRIEGQVLKKNGLKVFTFQIADGNAIASFPAWLQDAEELRSGSERRFIGLPYMEAYGYLLQFRKIAQGQQDLPAIQGRYFFSVSKLPV